MASRRSALSLASTLRAATPTVIRCAATTPRSFLTAARPVTARTLGLGVGRAQVGGRRWLTTEDADGIPGGRTWSADEIKEELKRRKEGGGKSDVVFVDVREPSELHTTGKIPSSINIPITTAIQSFHIPAEDFEEMYGFPRPDKTKELMFYCKAGVRAKSAAGLARHAGWERVGVYYGSWLDWEKVEGEVQRVREGEESD